jgi:hypothetical protein
VDRPAGEPTEPPAGATPVEAHHVPGRHADLSRQIAPLLIIAGLLGSALIMVPEQFGYRAACAGIAATCLVAAVIRAVLPTSWVGVLAVRGRVLDVLMYSVAGVGVVVLAFTVPLPGA